MIQNLNGGGIIVSPIGTGNRTNSGQVDSSTGDSQLSFGVSSDFNLNSNERIPVGTRSFERGMRQRRSIANSNLLGGRFNLPNDVALENSYEEFPPAAQHQLLPQQQMQQSFIRGGQCRRSLQPQPSHFQHQAFLSNGVDGDLLHHHHHQFGDGGAFGGGVNISSLDEQAERMAANQPVQYMNRRLVSEYDNLNQTVVGSSGGKDGQKQSRFLSNLFKKMLPSSKQKQQPSSSLAGFSNFNK